MAWDGLYSTSLLYFFLPFSAPPFSLLLSLSLPIFFPSLFYSCFSAPCPSPFFPSLSFRFLSFSFLSVPSPLFFFLLFSLSLLIPFSASFLFFFPALYHLFPHVIVRLRGLAQASIPWCPRCPDTPNVGLFKTGKVLKEGEKEERKGDTP